MNSPFLGRSGLYLGTILKDTFRIDNNKKKDKKKKKKKNKNNNNNNNNNKLQKQKQTLYGIISALTVPKIWSTQISTQSAHEGGKFVSPTRRPPLPPVNITATHFC